MSPRLLHTESSPAVVLQKAFIQQQEYSSSGRTSASLALLQTVHHSVAVMGIALVAMAEDVGQQMASRALEHLLQYGEAPIR